MRPISELFQHPGHIYVYCASEAVKAMFAHDLDEQGFAFGDGARTSQRQIDSLMAVCRDHTIAFCGYASHVRCGSLANPVYVTKDSSCNCTRVDYARFVSGADDYVIRGPQGSFEHEEGQPLPAGSYYVWD